MIWTSGGVPARNDGDFGKADFDSISMSRRRAARLSIMEVPAGKTPEQVWMHATNTLDYAVIVKGRLELVTEDRQNHSRGRGRAGGSGCSTARAPSVRKRHHGRDPDPGRTGRKRLHGLGLQAIESRQSPLATRAFMCQIPG